MHVGCNLNKCNSFISFSKNHNCIFKYFMVNCILLQIFVLSVWNIVVFENLQVASYSVSIFSVIYYKIRIGICYNLLQENTFKAKYRKYLHSKALLSQFASLVKCFRLQMLCIKFMQLHLLRNTANNITYVWLLKSTTAKNTTILQQTTT